MMLVVECTVPFKLFLRGGYIHTLLWQYIVDQAKQNKETGDLLCPDIEFGNIHGAYNAIKDLIGEIVFNSEK